MERVLVVVGASLGGFDAIATLLSTLSAGFPWPLAIVQHRSAEDVADTLPVMLQRRCALPVHEAEDKDPIVNGHVYVAPPDYHLLIDGGVFALSTEARVSLARPSIDVLFDSAAAAFGSSLVAVVLTGASSDGAFGAQRVKAAGGTLLVQDPATAESRVMPLAAIGAAAVDQIVPIGAMGEYLNRLAATRR
ncbi:MAG: cheB 1 [Myxococcaceae bacterium]|nr:cheB 1 [Myxococcaceae bacterium]